MNFIRKWLENRRIKAGLKYFKFLKENKPEASEKELSKELLIGRILQTKSKEWGLRSIEDAEYALEKLNAKYDTIENALTWIILIENPNRYSLVNKNFKELNELDNFFKKSDELNKYKKGLKNRILKFKNRIE